MNGGIFVDTGSRRVNYGWEAAKPLLITVKMDHQCYPIEKRTAKYGDPFHTVALAMKDSGVDAHRVAQTLSEVASFWVRVSRGDAKIEDFHKRYDHKDKDV